MKKPGEFKAQRERHLVRQRIQNALIALRRGETVWMTLPDRDEGLRLYRCKVEPPPEEGYDFYPALKAVCLVEGAIQVAYIVDKDGRRVFNTGGVHNYSYHIKDDKIFGLVVEQHEMAS